MTGLAYHAGVLSALADTLGWDPRSVDLVVGTSAGSITAAGLRAGLAASDIYARACGVPLSAEGEALLAASDAAVATSERLARAGRMRLVPAAPSVVLAAGRRPGRVRPGAVLAGLLPAGRISTSMIAGGVAALFPGGWPSKPTWVCAVRLDTGALTVFGRGDAPPAEIGDAVAASCAIPGYFAPVAIDGVRYVDGGAHSTTNLAAVWREGLDLVVVSAPMARAGTWPGVPPGIPAAIGALGRELNRLQLGIEARRLKGRGTPVVAFSPTLDDRAVMGLNPMDPGRRAPIARQARRSAMARLERSDVQERLAALTKVGRAQPA
jgi:NTE family protein